MMRILAALLALASCSAIATETGRTALDQSRSEARSTAPNERTPTVLEPLDHVTAQYWELSVAEMRRAKLLMRGPRGAFSDPRISPVEVLGVHARSDAERRKYAELFARMLHEDTERVLAWNRAGANALRRLYPDAPVFELRGAKLPNWSFAPAGGGK